MRGTPVAQQDDELACRNRTGNQALKDVSDAEPVCGRLRHELVIVERRRPSSRGCVENDDARLLFCSRRRRPLGRVQLFHARGDAVNRLNGDLVIWHGIVNGGNGAKIGKHRL